MRIAIEWMVVGIFCVVARAAPPPDFYLRDGDTVVFYGDSITDRLLYSIHRSLRLGAFSAVACALYSLGMGGATASVGGPVGRSISASIVTSSPIARRLSPSCWA